MHHRYLLFSAALLLAGTHARAQQAWQPFRPGLSYQYSEHATPGDTTHVLRLAAGAPVAGSAADSLFHFNSRVGMLDGPRGTTNCYGLGRVRPDNLFGATLRSQPHAVFILAAANGRTLTLRPRAALGQSWATGLPGLTASVTARSTAPVLGSAPDSVVTIQFSDGRSLRLSKSYGLLDGPSLDSYLNGRNARRALTLTALPERGLGTALTGFRTLYDFQPGDVFQRVTESYNTSLGYNLCQKTWQQDSILTRQVSRTGDTITYTSQSWKIIRGYGSVGAPISFCPSPSITTYSASSVTWTYTSKMVPAPLTNFYQPGNMPHTLAASSNNLRLAGRAEIAAEILTTCPGSSPDSLLLTSTPDFIYFTRHGVGLGLTFSHYGSIYTDDITNLTAFRKGSQSWGIFFRPGVLLATRAVQPAPTTTAFPNPFAEDLTVSFELTSAQPVAAALHDALGRQVRQLPATSLSAGPRQLALPTAGLPAGVYTLHLLFRGDGHSEVLKVLKAE